MITYDEPFNLYATSRPFAIQVLSTWYSDIYDIEEVVDINHFKLDLTETSDVIELQLNKILHHTYNEMYQDNQVTFAIANNESSIPHPDYPLSFEIEYDELVTDVEETSIMEALLHIRYAADHAVYKRAAPYIKYISGGMSEIQQYLNQLTVTN